MKKVWLSVLTAVLVLGIVMTCAFANGRGAGFTDDDCDGVCDNRSEECGSFADADEDGICDNREEQSCDTVQQRVCRQDCVQQGHGWGHGQHGRGQGWGHCKNG